MDFPSIERTAEIASTAVMRWPQVSVVIAAYNAADKVAGAVRAALGQSVRGLEVIVVDDASADATSAVIKQLQSFDPRVQLIRQRVNSGPAAARNAALRIASGEWIAIVDADDDMDPKRLETLLAIGNAMSLDMVADNQWLVDDRSGARFALMFPPSHLDQPKMVSAADFVRNNRPSSIKRKYGLLKPIIRREFLQRSGIRYDENCSVGEDFLLYLECLIHGARFRLIPEAHYYYQISRKSASQRRGLTNAADFVRQCDALLARSDVRAIPGLVDALRERSQELERDYVYLQFVNALKKHRLRDLVGVVREHPRLLPYIGAQGARVLRLRTQQWSGGSWRAAAVARHNGRHR